MSLILTPLLVLLAQSPPLPEQQVGGEIETRFTFEGQTAQARFGKNVDAGADIDGDGVGDILVSADLDDPSGQIDAGSVFVYSGADGSELLRIDGPAAGAAFGTSACFLSDVDGDLVPDILVGAPGVDGVQFQKIGAAVVHSGADGSQIHVVTGIQEEQFMGTAVAALGDIDGDLVDDFAVGSEWFDTVTSSNAGRVEVFSGADASSLLVIDGTQGFGLFGCAVDAMPDIDGDTVPDLLIGQRGLTPLGTFRAGGASVRSGATGAVIYAVTGSDFNDQMGSDVSQLQDYTGDGVPEFAVAGHNARANSFVAAGKIRVFDGATGSFVFPIQGLVPQGWFGYSVADAGDVDGDGRGDILVGAILEDENFADASGTAYVFSGRDRGLLFRHNGAVEDGNMGFHVAAAGDLDGDGNLEIVVSAPGTDLVSAVTPLLGAGIVEVLDLDPYLRGSENELSRSAGGNIDMIVDFPASEAGFDYMMLFSARPPGTTLFSGILLPLEFDSFTINAFNGLYPPIFSNAQGALDANGDTVVNLSVPPGALTPGAVGALFRACVVSADFGMGTPRLTTIATTLQVVP